MYSFGRPRDGANGTEYLPPGITEPELRRYAWGRAGPTCHLRAGITTPICTEGSHFCGVKVWLDFPNVIRRI